MKAEFKSFAITSVFFALPWFFCFWFINGNVGIAAFSAVIFGLLFAVFVRLFGLPLKRLFEAKSPVLNSDETILYSGRAIHKRGLMGVGGSLYLTSHRLLFQPNLLNFLRKGFSLSCAEIRSAMGNQKVWGDVQSRLNITDSTAVRHAFIVYQSKIWAEKIGSQVRTS